jgi:hypothetical protein
MLGKNKSGHEFNAMLLCLTREKHKSIPISSVGDPLLFGADPDPRIRTSD